MNKNLWKFKFEWCIFFWHISCIFCKILLGWMPIIFCQHWFRLWLGAVRQQAIIWTIVDQYLCHQIASLGDNELNRHQRLEPLYSITACVLGLDKFWTVVCCFTSSIKHQILDICMSMIITYIHKKPMHLAVILIQWSLDQIVPIYWCHFVW